MADVIYAPIGITYWGKYDPATEYPPLGWVTSDGNSYLCKSLAPIAGAPLPVPPATETAYWVLAASRGAAVELRPTDTAIQWRREDGEWADLISIATMTAAAAQAAASATQASEARAAAQAAQGAAEAAQGAAEAAQADAQAKIDSITGMTATAIAREPGTGATASVDLVAGVIRLLLGIPQGVQGVPGISPTITTQKQGKTTVVTVVDWEGTKTFEIDDGEAGTGTGNMHTSEWDPDGDGLMDIDKVKGLRGALDGKATTQQLADQSEAVTQQLAAQDQRVNNAMDAKADRATEIPVTIPSGVWQGDEAPYTAEVDAAGITATTKGEIGLSSSATVEQREAARAAMIAPTGTGAGKVYLAADGDKPTIDLPAVVTVLG